VAEVEKQVLDKVHDAGLDMNDLQKVPDLHKKLEDLRSELGI